MDKFLKGRKRGNLAHRTNETYRKQIRWYLTNILTVILNVNGINTSIKRQTLTDWTKITRLVRPNYILPIINTL